jgi:hypothetical protein
MYRRPVAQITPLQSYYYTGDYLHEFHASFTQWASSKTAMINRTDTNAELSKKI